MSSHGKVIVIEGMDGSGKQTQSNLLYDFFSQKLGGGCLKLISFPNYDEYSSMLVKKYLNGDFPKTQQDDITYRKQTSSFYASDRAITLHKINDNGTTYYQDYLNGTVLLMDRYTTSNILHQTLDMTDNEFVEYVNWLETLEYGSLGILKPDYVFFLNTPWEVSISRLSDRSKNQNKNKMENDIHENVEHLQKVSKCVNRIIKTCNWIPIDTYGNKGEQYSPEQINNEIRKFIIRNTEIL